MASHRRYKNEIEKNLERILAILPNSMTEIQVPIYLFANANLVTKYFNRFQDLEIINLCGVYGIQGLDTFSQYLNKEQNIIMFFQNLNLQNLKVIKIENCDEFLNHPLESICQKNYNLRELDIPNSLSRTGIGLTILATNCKFVEKLNLDNCCLSNKNLEILTTLKYLKILSLKRTKIADTTIIKIVQNNSTISKINLFNCKRITKVGVIALMKEAKDLTFLNIIGTKVNYQKGLLIFLQFGQIKPHFFMYCK